jgi:hypothetical protein
MAKRKAESIGARGFEGVEWKIAEDQMEGMIQRQRGLFGLGKVVKQTLLCRPSFFKGTRLVPDETQRWLQIVDKRDERA